jgi:hypothetical protein
MVRLRSAVLFTASLLAAYSAGGRAVTRPDVGPIEPSVPPSAAPRDAPCAAAGEAPSVVDGGAPACCAGLEPLRVFKGSVLRLDECVPEPGGAAVCGRCGDGRCGVGETACNCPSDCGPKGE